MLNIQTKNQNLDSKTNVKHRAYYFAIDVIKLVQDFPSNKTYQIFLDQLLRASTSIGANLIEAKASSSKKDFINFYHIALKSANETIYWLCLLRDSKLVDKEVISPLYNEVIEISKMLGSSLLTMKNKKS